VDAVRAVHVGVARWPEHRRGPCGHTAKRVARRIVLVVGLDLDDLPARAVDE
jgi:hypothetical protein